MPLIISAPGVGTAGTRSDSLVELLDLYPTLLELCGLGAPHDLQGTSLVPVLRDPNVAVKHAAMTQHTRPAYPAAGSDPEVMGYSIRTDRFRYTEWRTFDKDQVVSRELYDHDSDPRETVNVTDDPKFRNVIEEHSRRLNRIRRNERDGRKLGLKNRKTRLKHIRS